MDTPKTRLELENFVARLMCGIDINDTVVDRHEDPQEWSLRVDHNWSGWVPMAVRLIDGMEDAGLSVVPIKADIQMMKAAEAVVEETYPWSTDSLKAGRSILCWDAFMAMLAASPFSKKED